MDLGQGCRVKFLLKHWFPLWGNSGPPYVLLELSSCFIPSLSPHTVEYWCLQRFDRAGNLNFPSHLSCASATKLTSLCIPSPVPTGPFPHPVYWQVDVSLLLQVPKVPPGMQKESTCQGSMAISLKSTLTLLVLKIFFLPATRNSSLPPNPPSSKSHCFLGKN